MKLSEELYTVNEAASILEVSARMIYNYIEMELLERVYIENKPRITRTSLADFYLNKERRRVKGITTHRIDQLEERINQLEGTVDVLKLGLGFKKYRKPMSPEERSSFLSRVFRELAKPGWQIHEISKIADLVMGLTERDLKYLRAEGGDRAWEPILQLMGKLLYYIESRPEYPEAGLGVLATRVVRARDRLFGMVFATSSFSYRVGPEEDNDGQEISWVTNYMIEYLALKLAS